MTKRQKEIVKSTERDFREILKTDRETDRDRKVDRKKRDRERGTDMVRDEVKERGEGND